MASPSTTTRRLNSDSCWRQQESNSTLPTHSGANGVHSWEGVDEQDTSSPGGSSKDLDSSGSLNDDSANSDEVERDDRTTEASTDSNNDSDSSDEEERDDVASEVGTDSDSIDEVDGNYESSNDGTDSEDSSESNTNSDRSDDSDCTVNNSDHDNINNKCDWSFNLFKLHKSCGMFPKVSDSPILHGSPIPHALRAINVFYRQFLEEKGQTPAASGVSGRERNMGGGEDLRKATIGESEKNYQRILHTNNQKILDHFHGQVDTNQVAGNWCVATTVSEDGGVLKKNVDPPLNNQLQRVERSQSEGPQGNIGTEIGESNSYMRISYVNDSTNYIKECYSATESCGTNKASNKLGSLEGAKYFFAGKPIDIIVDFDKPKISLGTSQDGVYESQGKYREGCSTWDRSQDGTDTRDGKGKTCDRRTTDCGTRDRQKCEMFYTLGEVERETDIFDLSKPDSAAPSSHQTSRGNHRADPFLDVTGIKDTLVNETRNNFIPVAVNLKDRLDDTKIEYLAPMQMNRNYFRPEYKLLYSVSSEKPETKCDIIEMYSPVSPKLLINVCSPSHPTPDRLYSTHDNFLLFNSSGSNNFIQNASLSHEENFMRNPCQILHSASDKTTTCDQHSTYETFCLDNESKSDAVCNEGKENSTVELCCEKSGQEQALFIGSKKRYFVNSGPEQVSSLSSQEFCYVSSGWEQVRSIYSHELPLSSGLDVADPRHSTAGACEQNSRHGGGEGDGHWDGGSKCSGSSEEPEEGDDSIDKSEENSNDSEGESSESEKNSIDSKGSCCCESEKNREIKGCVNDEQICIQEESEHCSEEKSNDSSTDNEYELIDEFDVKSRSESIEVGTTTKKVCHLNLNNRDFCDDCKVLPNPQLIDDSVKKSRVKVRKEHSPCEVETSRETAAFKVKQQKQNKCLFESVCEKNDTYGIKLIASGGSHENLVKFNSTLSDGDDCLLDQRSNDKPSLSNVGFTKTSKPRELVADFSCSESSFPSEISAAAHSAQNISESDEICKNRHLAEAGTVHQLVPCITDTNSTHETRSLRANLTSGNASAEDASSDCETSIDADDSDGDEDTSSSSNTHNRTTDEDEARIRSILGLGQHGPSVSSDSAKNFMVGSEDSEQFWSSDSDEYKGYRLTNKYDRVDTNSYLDHSLFKNFDGPPCVYGEEAEDGDDGRPRELRCAGCDRVLTITVYSHLMRSKKCQGSYDMERVKLLHFEMMRLKKNAQNRYYNQRKQVSASHRDTTKTTCHGCDKKFVAILQHLVRSVSCRDHYDYEALVKERNKKSEENRVKNRKRYSETLRQENLPQNEAVLEECQGCGKKFVSLLKHLSNSKNCPEAYGGRDKVAAMASERRTLREQAYNRKKYLRKKEAICENARQYHHEHRDRIRMTKQRYRRMNLEKNRERARGYYKKVQDMRPEERERRRKQALERYHKKRALAKGDCSSTSQSREERSPPDHEASIYFNKPTGNPRLKQKEPPDWRDEVNSKVRNTCQLPTAEPSDLRLTEHQRLSKETFSKVNELRLEPPLIKEEDTDGEVCSIKEVKVEPETAPDNHDRANIGVRKLDNSGRKRLTKGSESMKKPNKKHLAKRIDIKQETCKDANNLDNPSVALTTGADNPDCERIFPKRRVDVSLGLKKSVQMASACNAQSSHDCTFSINVLSPNCSLVTPTSEVTRRKQLNTSRYNRPEHVVPPAEVGEAVDKNFTRKGTGIRKGLMSLISKNSRDFSEYEFHKPVDAHRAECDDVSTRLLTSNGSTASELCAFKHLNDAVPLSPKLTSGKKGGVKRTLESSDQSQFQANKKNKSNQ